MNLHNSILGTLDTDEELVIIQCNDDDDDDTDDFELYLTSYEEYDEGKII